MEIDFKKLLFFESPESFRKWLEEYHKSELFLWVGYYKKATNKPSINWEESVEQALCFGWIDGIRKRLDESSYTIRFTPRRKNSHWSAKNLNQIKKLIEYGLISEQGLLAYTNRNPERENEAAYEQGEITLGKEYEDLFKKEIEAWSFFDQKLAPSYKKISIHWVIRAKQEKTRLKRLQILIKSCSEGKKIPQLRK